MSYKRLKDLKVGDTAFEQTPKLSYNHYEPVVVTRVTSTQVTVSSGRRYSKSSGVAIGESNFWHPHFLRTELPSLVKFHVKKGDLCRVMNMKGEYLETLTGAEVLEKYGECHWDGGYTTGFTADGHECDIWICEF